METDVQDEVLATVGDFIVYLCCCGADCIWVERLSTGEASDMPKAAVDAVLGLPEEQRATAMHQCWHAHF